MKNRKTQLTAILFVALALAPIIQASPAPGGGPTRNPGNSSTVRPPANSSTVRAPVNANSEAIPANSDAIPEQGPVLTIHRTDNVIRGKTGSFVLNMKPALLLGGMYVNFSIKGTAVAGVDYVQPLSPAYLGQSGYGAILIHTLPDPRGSSFRQAYSVIVTLEAGAGYALGIPNSATMWIKP
jgi:hypothetical protein